jgi:hypothetical protein
MQSAEAVASALTEQSVKGRPGTGPVRICDDSNRRDFGSRAGRGRHREDGEDPRGGIELAVIVLEPPAMSEDERGAFRHVEAAAAADADDQVRGEGTHGLGAAIDILAEKVGFRGVEHLTSQPGALKAPLQFGKGVAARKACIDADECLQSKPRRNASDRSQLAVAEQDLTRQPHHGELVQGKRHADILRSLRPGRGTDVWLLRSYMLSYTIQPLGEFISAL